MPELRIIIVWFANSKEIASNIMARGKGKSARWA